jgi:hypothetical protein
MIARMYPDVLDTIASNLSYEDSAAIAVTCKQLNSWNCHRLARETSELSRYVQHLLETFDHKDVQKALLKFPDKLYTTPLSLTVRKKQCDSLQAIIKKFPNVEEVSYQRGVTIHVGKINELFQCIIGCTALLTFGICATPLLLYSKASGVSLPNLYEWLPAPVRNLTERAANVVGEIFLLFSNDPCLKKIASCTEESTRLHIIIDKQFEDIGALWSQPALVRIPKFSKLKELKIVNTGDLHVRPSVGADIFAKFTALESLHLDIDIESMNVGSRCDWIQPSGMIKKLFLGERFRINQVKLQRIVSCYQELKSLEVCVADGGGDNVFQIITVFVQGVNLTELTITEKPYEDRGRWFRHPYLFSTFPNVRSLKITANGINALHPSSQLEELSIDCSVIDEGILHSIFINYPKLKSLHLSFKEGPNQIDPPASHPNLVLSVERK